MSHKPINTPKSHGYETSKNPTNKINIPKIMSLNPHRLSPDFERIRTIPVIIKIKPSIQTTKPTNQVNSAGLNMNPIPKIKAIIPKINKGIPKLKPSSISDIPANIRPIPTIRTKNPERKATGITPNAGKAITIRPRIIKINAVPIFCIFFSPQ